MFRIFVNGGSTLLLKIVLSRGEVKGSGGGGGGGGVGEEMYIITIVKNFYWFRPS